MFGLIRGVGLMGVVVMMGVCFLRLLLLFGEVRLVVEVWEVLGVGVGVMLLRVVGVGGFGGCWLVLVMVVVVVLLVMMLNVLFLCRGDGVEGEYVVKRFFFECGIDMD